MTNYQQIPSTARVWVYQSNRPFSEEIALALREQIEQFVTQWTAHNQALRAWGDLLHQRFIVLMVDESQAGASGCSIDKSVNFIKAIEQATGVDFFDRFQFAYLQGDELRAASRDEFAQLYQKGEINDNTLVFNNLVKNKAEFEAAWKIPLQESWHRNFVL